MSSWAFYLSCFHVETVSVTNTAALWGVVKNFTDLPLSDLDFVIAIRDRSAVPTQIAVALVICDSV